MAFETILTQQQIDEYTDQGYWQGRIITDFLDEAAERTPAKLAAVDPRGQVSYAELKQQVDRVALGFLELGIRPGDVISFQIPNWIEWLIVHYAATRIGAVSNPLIPIYREREVEFMMKLAESKLVVVPQTFRGFDHLAMMQRIRPNLPDLDHVLVIDGDTSGAGTSWAEFSSTPWEERRDPGELTGLRPDANEVTLVIFTSGTTGEPKGVMHTHNTLVSAINPVPERLGASSDSVIHMASTFAHLTGASYGARLATQLGATGIYQDTWNAAQFIELVEKYQVDITCGATPFLHDLLSAPSLTDHDVTSLERFGCFGAPIPRVVLREAREKLPHTAFLGGWGQTENGLVTLGVPGDPEEKVTGRDGRPFPGMQLRVVDLDGRELPAGTDGRVQVKGPFLFAGYAKRLEMTRGCFSEDWFDTGDIASIDDEGYLSVSGRTKDVIIRGGENIPVAYVENALYENPKLDSVAVVGIPDPRLQERACAVVVLKAGVDGFTFEEMRQFLSEKGVAKQYWPERLEVLPELPKTASGKIQKFQLRDQITAQS
jgi:glutaryl-CoA dehydrogenase/cyclohexanecarboxylate-CoA ligase